MPKPPERIWGDIAQLNRRGNPQQKNLLLHEIMLARCSELVDKVSSTADLLSLSHDERMVVIDKLGDEFVEYGLNPDDTPNARGLMPEGLIDDVNDADSPPAD